MTHTLVDLIERLRGDQKFVTRGSEIIGEMVPCNLLDEAADLLASYHTLAQALGFTGDDPVGEALKAILVKDAKIEALHEELNTAIIELIDARHALATPSPPIIDETGR